MLLGRSLRDVALLLPRPCMIVLAIPFGLASTPGVVAVAGLVALIGLAFAPLSYAVALNLKSEDALAPLARPSPCRCSCCQASCCRSRSRRTGCRPSHAQPADPRGRRGAGAVQRPWGDPQILVGSVVGTLAILSVWIASRAFARTNA